MCTRTANTNFILRHTTTPPIPSTSKDFFSGCHLWTTIFDTTVQYALHFSYLQVIARKRDGEAPITNRRSVDMHSLEGNNGERCLYSRWDAGTLGRWDVGTAVLRKWQGSSKLKSAGCA